MSFAETIVACWMKDQSPEEKLDMLCKIMPKLIETMSKQDTMTVLSQGCLRYGAVLEIYGRRGHDRNNAPNYASNDGVFSQFTYRGRATKDAGPSTEQCSAA